MQTQKEPNHNIYQTIKKTDPLQDGISSVELVRVSGSDLDIANAARVSYGKISYELSDKDKKLVRFLMLHDHTSPFEHNQLSFRIKCPMFVARQWMRHRMHSYNEISYRYAEAPLEFYIPKKWRYQHQINHQASEGEFEDVKMHLEYKKSIEQAVNTYKNMLNAGICRELARGILPVCVYTQFIFTTNLHALTHFLKLRLGEGAQSEIRDFARDILHMATEYFPTSIEAWKEKNGIDY
jgi:thymidylate synthase (FAD)